MRKMKKTVSVLLCSLVLMALMLPTLTIQAQAGRVWDGLNYTEQTIQNSAGRNVKTFVVQVRLKNSKLSIAAGIPNDKAPLKSGVRQTVIGQAQAARNNNKNVLAAINGDFFYTSNRIPPEGLTIRNGEQLSPYKSGKFYFFGILNDGTAIIGNRDDYTRLRSSLKQAIGGGGWLVKDGKTPASYSNYQVHPRTAVGIKADGSVLFVVADGRSKVSAGLSLPDLAAYMKKLGCTHALNLDGGGSSTLVLKSPDTRQLVTKNVPCDGRARAVANSLMVVDSTPLSKLDEAGAKPWLIKLTSFLDSVVYYVFFGWVKDVF